MSQREDIICRFCLRVSHSELVFIDETSGHGLDMLLVKMNCDVSNNPLLCENCANILKKLLSFIILCLDSEKATHLFDTGEDDINIDSTEVCTYNSEEFVHGASYICRFCMEDLGETNIVRLNDLLKKNTFPCALKEYWLQKEQNIIKRPPICPHCRDNIEGCIKILGNCHDVEEKVNTYLHDIGTSGAEKLTPSNSLQFSKYDSEYSEKQVCVVKKEPSMEAVTDFEFIDMYELKEVKKEYATGDEVINTLLPQNDDTRDHISCTCDEKDSICLGYCARSNEVLPVKEEIKIETVSSEVNRAFNIESEELSVEDDNTLNDSTDPQINVHKFGICICNTKINNCSKCNSQFEIVSRGPTVYKCKLCPYQGVWIRPHMLKHRDISEVTTYQCTACDFKTKYKNRLKSHSLTHKTEAEVTMYKCTVCDFKTKRRDTLKNHSSIHKDEAPVYKCMFCNFETIDEEWLKSHLLAHKAKTEIRIYKCPLCDFETKYKKSLKKHSLTHKSEAEVTMYKCPTCNFATKHKNNLKCHSLTHKSEAELTMYKCTACDYKTIRKNDLKSHSLTHKTEAEATVYKCMDCDYKTMRKNDLKNHSVTHKSEAEVTMYKCTSCDFKTKHKNSIECHLLIHKTEAEVTMYKCSACDFKTKHKNGLTRHSLTHKGAAEVTMYKCTVCDFETKHNYSLKSHSLIHKTEAEVTIYKCTVCDFKTKHKKSLKKHSLSHKTKAGVKNKCMS